MKTLDVQSLIENYSDDNKDTKEILESFALEMLDDLKAELESKTPLKFKPVEEIIARERYPLRNPETETEEK